MYNGGKLPGNDTRAGKEIYANYGKEKWKLAADAARALMTTTNNGSPRI